MQSALRIYYTVDSAELYIQHSKQAIEDSKSNNVLLGIFLKKKTERKKHTPFL